MAVIETINPTSGEVIRRYESHTPAELDTLAVSTATAQRDWARTPVADRCAVLRCAAQILREREDALANLMAVEMGKPTREGKAEIQKCAWVLDHYGQHAESMLAPQLVPTEAATSYVAFEPLGTVLGIMPWNYPFWQVMRAAAPTLAAGNAFLLKHAPSVTGCSIEIERVFAQAGGPPGLVTNLIASAEATGDLVAHPAIAAVTLTGSVRAGRAVAQRAGAALKKCVLELGGSDPYVVLHDADIPAAAKVCAQARLLNAGQSCIACKRVIVDVTVHDEFVRAFVEEISRARMGDPIARDTDLGPLAREDLRDDLHRLVLGSLRDGATLRIGGKIPKRKGWFYPPTVLTGVRPSMPVFTEETFGPVAAVTAAQDTAQAVELANQTEFGLGAAVFTRDRQRGEALARAELRAGCCSVNAAVRSDPRLPFGGIQASGYGRELGTFGIHEFVNVKTVVVR